MNKTKIEWTDYTLNPIKGKCKMGCSYCYARRIYDRFKWNPEIRFVPEVLAKILKLRKPSKIFLCSTHEMFGDWIPARWIWQILSFIGNFPKHTFQILTKNPSRAKDFYFPDNAWVGVTVTGEESACRQWNLLKSLAEVNVDVRFFSFEPLLAQPANYRWEEIIEWIIIGGQSGKDKFYPAEEWIQRIEQAVDKLGIPIFEKDNLRKTWIKPPRREFPDRQD